MQRYGFYFEYKNFEEKSLQPTICPKIKKIFSYKNFEEQKNSTEFSPSATTNY